ncbi:hypothetical protein [Roseateles sp.]|uniref:DUF6970 domain-containing protein n=1 Tax=Roseateles sp. TaxID=1971397 RepID=UPI0025D9EBCE|nr:hypothetical protein [Roseateles sp.]MBV8036069.1 hypothetical protein [Roseateles sp.]
MHSPVSPTWWYAGIAAALMLSAAAIATRGAQPRDAVPAPLAQPDPAMRERIGAFERGSTREPTSMMAFKRPDGQVFYLVNAPCCDHFNYLYDADGRRICAPTGGFGGSGDGRCPAWVGPLRQGLQRSAHASGRPMTAQGY